jgi:predicted glycosyltransferase
MKILVDIVHPADVHVIKNFIWEMEKRGHEILVTARNKDVAVNLLDAYNIKYTIISKAKKGLLNLGMELITRDLKLLNIARMFNPDILIGLMNPSITHIAWLLNRKSIMFTDTEHEKLINYASFPFASCICTPKCYTRDLGKKQVRYDSYHEVAYLHSNYFTPNPAVLEEIGLSENDTFIIMRFVSWGASHDVGQSGLTMEDKKKAVQVFEKYGRVLITSESPLPYEFEKYRITISPEKIHDLLYYATLLYGESSTMASECAVLGTHAIFVNTLRLGYTDEEEEKYDLVYNFNDRMTMGEQSIKKALELMNSSNLRQKGKEKGELLSRDKIDVTAFMVNFVESQIRD